jgi:hypothetical protein
MKQIFLLLVAATLFAACKKTCTCTGYTIDNDTCECVVFLGTIGTDFDSALDSLERYYEPEFNLAFERGFYSGQGYFVEKSVINVDFNEDDRTFFRVIFIDSADTYRWLNMFPDILDEKGNYYIRMTWRED